MPSYHLEPIKDRLLADAYEKALSQHSIRHAPLKRVVYDRPFTSPSGKKVDAGDFGGFTDSDCLSMSPTDNSYLGPDCVAVGSSLISNQSEVLDGSIINKTVVSASRVQFSLLNGEITLEGGSVVDNTQFQGYAQLSGVILLNSCVELRGRCSVMEKMIVEQSTIEAEDIISKAVGDEPTLVFKSRLKFGEHLVVGTGVVIASSSVCVGKSGLMTDDVAVYRSRLLCRNLVLCKGATLAGDRIVIDVLNVENKVTIVDCACENDVIFFEHGADRGKDGLLDFRSQSIYYQCTFRAFKWPDDYGQRLFWHNVAAHWQDLNEEPKSNSALYRVVNLRSRCILDQHTFLSSLRR